MDIHAEILKRNPAKLYGQGGAEDQTVFVKLFDPCGSWTWYLTEYDPDEKMAFGLVDGFERELGYFSIEEMAEAKGPLGLGIEVDLYWAPRPLSQV